MHVAIVGEGEERSALEKKIAEYKLQDRVRLFGFMPASEVLKGFDEFVLPSKKEGLPYVLLEARAAGVPTRGNRVGGVGEALDLPLEEFSLERMLEKTFALYRS
jgi:glycosyltransferase involved in cell wall biosynthesis